MGVSCQFLDVTNDDAEDLGGTHHLVAVPGLGTLTARGLTGGDLEDLGGETNGWGSVVRVSFAP